jgi:hypothetical protein
MYQMNSAYYPAQKRSCGCGKTEHMSYPRCISQAEVQLMNAFRSIWQQHVEWARMTIISIAEKLPDEALVTKRFLRNATDMANLLKPFYGPETASQFEALIKDHFVIAAQLVKAAQTGDTAKAAEIEKKWYANANEMALFLSRINPYWSYQEMQAMWYEHLALTKNEAVFRLKKDYASDIATYDRIEQQALMMADMFTNGIVKQFYWLFQPPCHHLY